MHKGYTLSYLINFYSNTTNADFTNGHVASLNASAPGRVDALNNFLGGSGRVSRITAGSGAYAALGATPRTRLLRALRNRKRTGSVLISN